MLMFNIAMYLTVILPLYGILIVVAEEPLDKYPRAKVGVISGLLLLSGGSILSYIVLHLPEFTVICHDIFNRGPVAVFTAMASIPVYIFMNVMVVNLVVGGTRFFMSPQRHKMDLREVALGALGIVYMVMISADAIRGWVVG